MGQADVGVRLLTAVDRREALARAQQLDAWNRQRQALEEKVLEEALAQVESGGMQREGALVLASEGWHPGVVGIVASRLVERFHRPAVVIALKDGMGKGSARSIPGFHLCRGLSACADLLVGFGGHEAAAGLTVRAREIPRLRERLAGQVLETVGEEGLIPRLAVDAWVEPKDLSVGLVRELRQLAPFGMGNPEPTLLLSSLRVTEARVVGNDHLRLRLRSEGGGCLDAIGFRFTAHGYLPEVVSQQRVDVAFALEEDTWSAPDGGIRLVMKDIRPAGGDPRFRG